MEGSRELPAAAYDPLVDVGQGVEGRLALAGRLPPQYTHLDVGYVAEGGK